MGSSTHSIEPKHCKVCQNVMQEQFDSYVDTCTECLPEYSQVLLHADGVWIWQKAVD